jgi:hypothetical protein
VSNPDHSFSGQLRKLDSALRKGRIRRLQEAWPPSPASPTITCAKPSSACSTPGNWPLQHVASIPPLLTPAWSTTPPTPAPLRQHTPRQLSQLSLPTLQTHPLPKTKLLSTLSPQKPPTQLSQPSQASWALRRPPRLNMTWPMAPQNHPSPTWKLIRVSSPQNPPCSNCLNCPNCYPNSATWYHEAIHI